MEIRAIQRAELVDFLTEKLKTAEFHYYFECAPNLWFEVLWFKKANVSWVNEDRWTLRENSFFPPNLGILNNGKETILLIIGA